MNYELKLSVLSLLISLISVIISLITAYNNRKRLNVEIEPGLSEIDDIFLNIIDYENNSPIMNFGHGRVCYIKVVNPSPCDIAFFDLRVVDLKKN
ncbi:hypothetical protein IO99_13855 [Clostridium sulfidigenes]|uniref:Uncharacterized protein n=1 Tax=Clostridium sulfidigenes TaxID=318464 RepID=A0A084J9E0_9CLOT|nr:hypothetical protein [Clostridium sulfidigenes]KEZ85574.1 hypothetical protein IO99_13855 [Clostridium sulfidigenes]